MRLLELKFQDFRNLATGGLQPAPRATVVVGPNGQGKTNLLEALFFVATLKPLRANRLSELIRFGQDSAQVTARFSLQGAERTIHVELQDGTRQAFVDGKKAQSLEEYFGGVSVVAFTPDDLQVIKGAPEERRHLLDRAVFNRFPAFLQESRTYARALRSRNRLLKEGADAGYLQVFDQTLAQAGARIWTRRRALMSELGPRAQNTFASIGRTPDPAFFGYRASHLGVDFAQASEADLVSAFLEALGARSLRDRERGFTSVGPHVDDVELRLGERLARSFASQGQQRALVLAWKIAEIENLQGTLGFLPLLLLDDVSSELDPERNAYLMGYLAESGAQVFLTTTDASLVEKAAGADSLWLRVEKGQLRPRSEP